MDARTDTADGTPVDHVELQLRHVHLPKLADRGFVEPAASRPPGAGIGREFQPPSDGVETAPRSDHTVASPRFVADVGGRRADRTGFTDEASAIGPVLAGPAIRVLAFRSAGDCRFLRVQLPIGEPSSRSGSPASDGGPRRADALPGTSRAGAATA